MSDMLDTSNNTPLAHLCGEKIEFILPSNGHQYLKSEEIAENCSSFPSFIDRGHVKMTLEKNWLVERNFFFDRSIVDMLKHLYGNFCKL